VSVAIEHARVVILGGGAVGASVLYHLTAKGWHDAILVERDELASGSTWHAAGNCPNFSTSAAVMAMQAYSTRLYAELGKRTGSPIDYHVTGSLRLAHGRERIDEFHRVAAMARARGLAFEVVSPFEARKRYPFLQLHDLAGALWDPGDGDIDPSQLTQAYAKGARDAGARIRRFTRVTALARAASGEWRVTTDKGDIVCETIVNAAGYRAGEIMALLGRRLPVVALSHQYLVTEAIPVLAARGERLPLLRDPDASYYLRQERDGCCSGPTKPTPAFIGWMASRTISPTSCGGRPRRLETYIADAVARVPLLGTVGVRRVINGPIPTRRTGILDRSRARSPGLLPVLRVHVRHRAIGRCRACRGRVDRRGRAAVGHLAL
jgi:dimethylglycine dehydrogenase